VTPTRQYRSVCLPLTGLSRSVISGGWMTARRPASPETQDGPIRPLRGFLKPGGRVPNDGGLAQYPYLAICEQALATENKAEVGFVLQCLRRIARRLPNW